MTHDEAEKTMCPLSTNDDHCVADKCNWWLEAEPDEGECVVMAIGKAVLTPLILTQGAIHGTIPEGQGFVSPSND